MSVSNTSKERLLCTYIGLDTLTHLVRILHSLKFGKALLLVEKTCGVHTQHNVSAPITWLGVERFHLRHGWHLCWAMLSQWQIRSFDPKFQSKSGHQTTFKLLGSSHGGSKLLRLKIPVELSQHEASRLLPPGTQLETYASLKCYYCVAYTSSSMQLFEQCRMLQENQK